MSSSIFQKKLSFAEFCARLEMRVKFPHRRERVKKWCGHGWRMGEREKKKPVRRIAILANVHKVAANARLCLRDSFWKGLIDATFLA